MNESNITMNKPETSVGIIIGIIVAVVVLIIVIVLLVIYLRPNNFLRIVPNNNNNNFIPLVPTPTPFVPTPTPIVPTANYQFDQTSLYWPTANDKISCPTYNTELQPWCILPFEQIEAACNITPGCIGYVLTEGSWLNQKGLKGQLVSQSPQPCNLNNQPCGFYFSKSS